jgi:hypothetical protein
MLAEMLEVFVSHAQSGGGRGGAPNAQALGMEAAVEGRERTLYGSPSNGPHGGGTTERPERVRHLAIEISDLLNKRRPNLGDALNALQSEMLTAIEANYGREKANEYDLLNAWFSEEVRRFLGGRVQ